MRRLVVVLIVVLFLAGVVVVGYAPRVARDQAERLLGDALGARVSIDDVSGLLGGRLRVRGVKAHRHGAWRVAIPEVVVTWSPRALLDRRLEIAEVVATSPRIAATERAPETFPKPDSSESSGWMLSLERIRVTDGRVVLAVRDGGERTLYGGDRIELDVRPVVRDAAWEADLARLRVRPRGRPIPTIDARGLVHGDGATVVTRLEATLSRLGDVRIRARAGVDREPLRFRAAFVTRGLDVRAIVPDAPIDRARGRIRVRGTAPPDGPHLAYTAKVGATGTPAGPVSALVDGQGRGTDQRVQAVVEADGVRATVRATADLDAATVDARVRSGVDLRALGRRLGLPLAGRATVVADVRGPFASPRVAATVDAVEPAYGATRLARLATAVAVERHDGGVRVEIARLEARPPRGSALALQGRSTLTLGETIVLAPATIASAEGRVTIGGRLGPGPAVDLRVVLARLDLPRLCETLALGTCTGIVDAQATLRGAGPAPRLDATVRHSIGAALVATGTAPFPWPSAGAPLERVPFALSVRGDGFDVAALQPLAGGAVVELGGRLDVALALRGPLREVAADGRLHLTGGRLRSAVTGVRYEDVELGLRLERGAVVIERIAARAGGTLDGSGRIALEGDRPGAVDVRLVLDGLRVANDPAVDADASGTIAIGGRPDAPTARGTIEIPRAVIRPPTLPSSDVPLAPDPTIEVVGRDAPRPEPKRPPVADALAVDLDVTLGDDVKVRRIDARIDLAGRLRVTKAPFEQPRAVGQIRLERGWAEFQGRRFTVEPSVIRFDGPPERPTLDVTAMARVGDYDVTVRVSGPADKPVLALSSEPPLPESDVLAVLVFGAPTQDLGQSQQAELQRRALGLATSYVAGGLTRSFRERLGLDLFNVAVGDREKPGEVRIGRYVTDDVFVSVAQEFGARVGQVASVTYRLRPRVSVRLSTSTTGASAVDAFWHRRY